MVCPAVVGSADRACDENVSLSRDGKDQVVHGSRMLPGVLQSDREMEDSISYEKLMLSTYAEKAKPVVIALPMGYVSDHWNSCFSFIPHSDIKVARR